jgi:hypothetical protein
MAPTDKELLIATLRHGHAIIKAASDFNAACFGSAPLTKAIEDARGHALNTIQMAELETTGD